MPPGYAGLNSCRSMACNDREAPGERDPRLAHRVSAARHLFREMLGKEAFRRLGAVERAQQTTLAGLHATCGARCQADKSSQRIGSPIESVPDGSALVMSIRLDQVCEHPLRGNSAASLPGGERWIECEFELLDMADDATRRTYCRGD